MYSNSYSFPIVAVHRPVSCWTSRRARGSDRDWRWPGCPIVRIDDRLYALPEWEHARETWEIDGLAARLGHSVVSFACLANI
jgi:hypothetical protein